MELDVNSAGNYVPPTNGQNGYNLNQPAAPNVDQILINAYIGKNAEAICSPTDGKARYNMAAALLGLFFGPVWFFYRKSYLVGLGFLLLTILFRVASVFSHSIIVSLLIWGCHLTLAALYLFFANSLYLNGVKKKVNQIKQQNPQRSVEELSQIAGFKGGVSIPAAIVYAFALFIVIVITVALSIFGLIKTAGMSKGDQLKIYDGLGTVSFKQGMLNTFSNTSGQGKPSSNIIDNTSFELVSPTDKAETMFTIYHTSDFRNITSVQQYLLASGLESKIKSSKFETSKKVSVFGNESEELTAVITSDATDKYPTHKYVLDASLGKYYTIVALTSIREQDIKSDEAKEWLGYMKSVKVVDNSKSTWSPSNIIGEPLYHQIGKVVQSDRLNQPSQTPVSDNSSSSQSGTSGTGTLKSGGTQIDVSLPDGYKNVYSSNYSIALSKDSYKYEVDITKNMYSSVDSYIQESLRSSYDYKAKEKDYKNLRMSEPSSIVSSDGREYQVVRVNYTYDLGFGTPTDYEEAYAVTQANKDNVYVVKLTSRGDSVSDNMIKDFLNIKVSSYDEN